jgi:hypothetical protein
MTKIGFGIVEWSKAIRSVIAVVLIPSLLIFVALDHHTPPTVTTTTMHPEAP